MDNIYKPKTYTGFSQLDWLFDSANELKNRKAYEALSQEQRNQVTQEYPKISPEVMMNSGYGSLYPSINISQLPQPPAPSLPEASGVNAMMLPQPPASQSPLRDLVDKINNNGMGTQLNTPQSQPLPLRTDTQLTDAQINSNPYKQGTSAYIINNLQQHGYNPQQIADYLAVDKKEQPQESPYMQMLKERLNTPVYERYASGQIRGLDSEATQKQQLEAAKILYDLEQSNKKQEQAGKLTPAEREKMQFEKELQEIKNLGTIEAEKAKMGSGGKALTVSELSTLKDSKNALSRLYSLLNTYAGKDKEGLFGTTGLVRRSLNNAAMGTLDPVSNQYNQDIGMLKRSIAKAYEGGRMSDQDRMYYDKTLFNPNVDQSSFTEALNKYKEFLQSDLQNTIQTYSTAGRNVSGFQNQTTNNSSGIVKYQLNGKTYNIPVEKEEEMIAEGGVKVE